MNNSSERPASQPKIDDKSFEKLKPYSTKNFQYNVITNAVTRMIAKDFQPFSFIEDEAFKLL